MRSTDLLFKLSESSCDQSRLLPQVLEAIQWPGEAIQLRNALSGSPEQLDSTDLLNTLANLGYRWDVKRIRPGDLRDCESLSFPVLARADQAASGLMLLGSSQELQRRLRSDGAQLIYELVFEPERIGEQRGWFQAQVLRFRRIIAQLYLVSLLINLLALVLPFYIRAVYNIEIPGGQAGDLFLLMPLAMLAVGLQVWLTQRRQSRLAFLGGELDLLLVSRVLNKLLRLRLPQLERYSPLAMANRLRVNQSLRTYVTGPLALAALDLPFIVIYLAAIASISVVLMALTVVMVLVCFGGVWAVGAAGKALQESLRRHASGLEALTLDLVQNLDLIKASGSERIWQHRLELASASQAREGVAAVRLQQLIAILTGEFSQLTGALVLAVGAALALAGDGIELGTLIAAMFFVWRVFRPIQMAYQALSRAEQMRESLTQLNQFMLNREVEEDSTITQHWPLPDPEGTIRFRNVNLRLNALQEPALSQLNLAIEARSFVVLSGAEGAGSSSVLKLLDGQIAPGSGVITINGADLRQYPLAQLRSSVHYLPEQAGLFPGTLRDNLLLANPLLDDAALREGLSEMALGELLEGPGLDRWLDMRGEASLYPHQIQAIALVRVFLNRPQILLLDQPFRRLAAANRAAFLQILKARRGQFTTVVASNDPEFLELAEQIVVLREGTVAFAGTPSELLAAQQKAQSSRPGPDV